MIKARKQPVIKPQLGEMVFHESIYKGRELMKVVGIRETEVELYGDYSGVNDVFGHGKDWIPIEGTFQLRKVCREQLNPKGCQLPNAHCGYPSCEPYLNNWGHYVDGKLVDEVELITT